MSGAAPRPGERSDVTIGFNEKNVHLMCCWVLFFFAFSCTFEDDCSDSDWVSIPDDLQQRMVSYGTAREEATGQVRNETD